MTDPPVASGPPATRGSERPGDDGDPGDPAPLPLFSVLSGLAAVLLVVAVLGVAVAGGLARYEDDPAAPPTTLPGDGGTPSGLPVVAADDPELGADAVRAGFDEDRDGLAPVAPIGPWSAIAGTWDQSKGEAALVQAGGDRSMVLLRPAVVPRIVQVTLATVETNAGLVAGYEDPTHYLVLVAVPAQRALWLASVDGDQARPRLLAVIGGVPLQPGIVIGLRMGDGRISVVVNGRVARTVARPVTGTAFGLTSGGAGSPATARFDDLAITLG